MAISILVRRKLPVGNFQYSPEALGKETVQNLMAVRFANALFEPLWRRESIASVQITLAESLGVGTRGDFYNRTGALRDMVQSHLLQILAIFAMEPIASLDPQELAGDEEQIGKLAQALGKRGQPILRGSILNTRPKKSAHAYRQVWTAEGSPLAAITLAEDGGDKTRLRCPACGWTHWNNPTPVLAAIVEYRGQVLLAHLAGRGGAAVSVRWRPSSSMRSYVAPPMNSTFESLSVCRCTQPVVLPRPLPSAVCLRCTR